jgi:hypothetical protein
MFGAASRMVSVTISISPPSNAAIACALPRYGTWVYDVPVRVARYSVLRWVEPPTPDEP